MNIRRVVLISLIMLSALSRAVADGTRDDVENIFKYRMGLDFQIKLIKGLKLNIAPEFRFEDGFDALLLDGGLTYKSFGFIYWGATYRMVIDRQESSSSSSTGGFGSQYEAELHHKYAFDVTLKEKFGRFTPSFRLRYNNYADEDITDKEFLRYRAKVEYDVPKCRVTPFVSVELFQTIKESELYKTRYSVGFDYKVNKTSSLGLDYKLDFFNLKYKNAHIISAGYKYKFK